MRVEARSMLELSDREIPKSPSLMVPYVFMCVGVWRDRRSVSVKGDGA